jgi:CheY-like chemotaxis protein
MSGIDLVKALRAHERWRHIPIVMVTGSEDVTRAPCLDTPVLFKPDIGSLMQALPAAARS